MRNPTRGRHQMRLRAVRAGLLGLFLIVSISGVFVAREWTRSRNISRWISDLKNQDRMFDAHKKLADNIKSATPSLLGAAPSLPPSVQAVVVATLVRGGQFDEARMALARLTASYADAPDKGPYPQRKGVRLLITAARSTGWTVDPEAVSPWLAADELYFRKAALELLALGKDQGVFDMVLESLGDSDVEVRRESLLRAVQMAESSPSMQSRLFDALLSKREEEGVDNLVGAADFAVALMSLAHVTDPRKREILEGIMRRTDLEERERALPAMWFLLDAGTSLHDVLAMSKHQQVQRALEILDRRRAGSQQQQEYRPRGSSRGSPKRRHRPDGPSGE